MMKDMLSGGEDDSWRHIPGAIATLSGNEKRYEQIDENPSRKIDLSPKEAYEILRPSIESGALDRYFRRNTDEEEFKRKWNNFPEIRDFCVTSIHYAKGKGNRE